MGPNEAEPDDDGSLDNEQPNELSQSDGECDNVEETTTHRYGLRERKATNYKNLHRYGEVQLLQLQDKW